MKKRRQPSVGNPKMDPEMDPEVIIQKIMKDVEFLGTSHMTWRERKEMENKKVVSLGGKAPKKQRLPLSVARPMMKNQKKRERKMLGENMILPGSGGKFSSWSSSERMVERRKPEDNVLKSSGGHFKNGVLDVKHLLRTPSRNNENDRGMTFGGKGKKKAGKKSKGRKWGGKKRR